MQQLEGLGLLEKLPSCSRKIHEQSQIGPWKWKWKQNSRRSLPLLGTMRQKRSHIKPIPTESQYHQALLSVGKQQPLERTVTPLKPLPPPCHLTKQTPLVETHLLSHVWTFLCSVYYIKYFKISCFTLRMPCTFWALAMIQTKQTNHVNPVKYDPFQPEYQLFQNPPWEFHNIHWIDLFIIATILLKSYIK